MLDDSNPDTFAKVIYFKEFVNTKTKQLVYKSVFMLKSFTTTMFLGIETLYKPTGFPSFEVLSYILDSEIGTIRKVMKDEDISERSNLACGDLKVIYSLKNF